MAIAEIVLDLFDTSGPGYLVPTANYASAIPYTKLITSEHNKLPKYMAWVTAVTAAIGDINAMAQAVNGYFNLNTATGVQLDIVGKWVGQSRIIPNVLLVGFFGFADDTAALGFGEYGTPSIGGKWYEYGAVFASTTILQDPDYRTIIRARIVRNQSNGTVYDIENALQFIFGASAFVVDGGTGTINITVSAPITQTAEALLTTLDLLPRPAGIVIGTISFNTGITVPVKSLVPSIIASTWAQGSSWNSQHQTNGLHFSGN